MSKSKYQIINLFGFRSLGFYFTFEICYLSLIFILWTKSSVSIN